jgi:hypothetical protein
MIVIVFIFFAVVILTTLIYLTISLLGRLLNAIKKERLEFIASKIYKRWTFAFSVICAISICYYYLFSNPAINYKTAYIEKSAEKYILTIYRQKSLMAHDPVSSPFLVHFKSRKIVSLINCFVVPAVGRSGAEA